MLALRVDEDPSIVVAERDAGVPDVFWGQLRIEWGYDGDPSRKVRVPIGRFRGNLGWLRGAAARYGVSISWTDEVLSIIATMKEERQALDAARREPNLLTPERVQQLLAGSRFVRPLKAFQLRDAGRLLALSHGANFSVPGAGKTTVAYAVYEVQRQALRVEQLLVVAPLSAFDAWQTEALDCFAEGQRPAIAVVADDVPAGAEVLLVNYHRLASNLEKLSAWVRGKRTLVLLDEAHRMKAGARRPAWQRLPRPCVRCYPTRHPVWYAVTAVCSGLRSVVRLSLARSGPADSADRGAGGTPTRRLNESGEQRY